jgi:hypothetical protein
MLDLSIDPVGGKQITFKSRHVSIRQDGQARGGGHLLRRVVPETNLNPGEDYYGPVYGKQTCTAAFSGRRFETLGVVSSTGRSSFRRRWVLIQFLVSAGGEGQFYSALIIGRSGGREIEVAEGILHRMAFGEDPEGLADDAVVLDLPPMTVPEHEDCRRSLFHC